MPLLFLKHMATSPSTQPTIRRLMVLEPVFLAPSLLRRCPGLMLLSDKLSRWTLKQEVPRLQRAFPVNSRAPGIVTVTWSPSSNNNNNNNRVAQSARHQECTVMISKYLKGVCWHVTDRFRTYAPPRPAWGDQVGRTSPPNPNSQQPAELPSPMEPNHRRIGSAEDQYYEDVDPRFAGEPAPAATLPPAPAVAPGYGPRGPVGNPNQNLRPIQPISHMDGRNSFETLAPGARSPAESERSNFTSVSQRGVNPRWNDGQGHAPMPTRRPVQQQQDLLLNSNPDFQLPGKRGGRGGFGRGGRAGL